MAPSDEKCERHTLELQRLGAEIKATQDSQNRHKAEFLAIGIRVDDHVKTSMDRVVKMEKHDGQILTLEKASLQYMEDIKKIYASINRIELNQERAFSAIKIWILSGMLAGLFAVSGSVIYGIQELGGLKKQVDVNTKKWELLDSKGGAYVGSQKSSVGN